jgi:Holliday junction resolvase RusA-like endonuclease
MTDRDAVSFFIEGVPIPQGSKTVSQAKGRAWLRDANAARLKPWRHVVATHADLGVTFDCPVTVTLSFVLPRPQKPRWAVPAVKPDIDKLTRAVLDGLTDGGLLADDARVVDLIVRKRYPNPGDLTGVGIDVTEWRNT